MHIPVVLPGLPIAVAALAAAAPAQTSLTLLEGATQQDLQLRVLDERDPTSTGQILLTQLEVLPVEITRRTVQQSLRPNRPRRLTRHGVPRIELPPGGRLLRYRLRGGQRHGVLWVDAGGAATAILELPSGIAQTNPFADRFAVANDGLHAAFITATGVLHLARLDGQVYTSTQSPTRAVPAPGVIDPVSVCAGATHVFFQTEDERVWRCAYADGAPAVAVTPPKAPGARLKEEMAMSDDGHSVVFLLGPKPLFDLWLINSTGPARKLAAPSSKYEEPGYLPETTGGPRLLLNETGTRLLFTDAINREEIYLLDTTGTTTTTHITSDGNFAPYIGTIIVPSFASNTVTLGIGDPDAFDWYAASTASAGIVSLTRTGGRVAPPYGAGTLVPTAGYPLASGLVLSTEVAPGGPQLRWLAPSTGTSGIAATALRGAPELGEGPAPVVLVPGQLGDALLTGSLATTLRGPAGIWLSAPEQGPGLSAFTATIPGGPAAAILMIPGGGLIALPPDPALRQVVLTAGNGLLLNGSVLTYARPGLVVTIPSPSTIRVVLS